MILTMVASAIGSIVIKIGPGLSEIPSQEYVIKAQKRIKDALRG